jgi:hypothetical protein
MGAFTIEGIVAGVFVSGNHTFSKSERQCITLFPGLGIGLPNFIRCHSRFRISRIELVYSLPPHIYKCIGS